MSTRNQSENNKTITKSKQNLEKFLKCLKQKPTAKYEKNKNFTKKQNENNYKKLQIKKNFLKKL